MWNFTKVSTSGRANGHQSIKKFTPDGSEVQILQVCHSPTQFLWKNRAQTQSCNSNTYSFVPLTTKFIYEELWYSSFQNSFLLVLLALTCYTKIGTERQYYERYILVDLLYSRALRRQIIRETEEEMKRFNSTDTRITPVTLLPGQHQVRNGNY